MAHSVALSDVRRRLSVYRSQISSDHGVWQVAPTVEEGGAILMSSKDVALLDFRVSRPVAP